MKRMKLLILITLLSLKAFCPAERAIYIEQSEAINPYTKLIYAIGAVECGFDTLAYNALEKGTGYFQIRPIRVAHYNQLTGEYLTLMQMFDYEIAEKVFLYFAHQIGPYDMEKIAKSWNGSGPLTIDYWNKVLKQL